jgi:hypothetical protein
VVVAWTVDVGQDIDVATPERVHVGWYRGPGWALGVAGDGPPDKVAGPRLLRTSARAGMR